MPISNMQQARQMYEYGGLSAPRQNYGLGSFVKKAIRGVKKVAKSPLGKAALIAGGGALAGSFMAGGAGTGFGRLAFSNMGQNFGALGGGISNLFRAPKGADKGGFLQSLIRKKDGSLSAGKIALGGLGVASMAPLFMGGGDDEVEEVGEVMDPRYQVQRAKNFYSGLGNKGAGLDFMPKKKYVDQNFYAANGGRAGYAGGGEIIDEEEEFMRTGAGQRFQMPQTFLAMGGGAGEAQAEQMLQAEFIKYKNKGGDLSFQEFVRAVM